MSYDICLIDIPRENYGNVNQTGYNLDLLYLNILMKGFVFGVLHFTKKECKKIYEYLTYNNLLITI